MTTPDYPYVWSWRYRTLDSWGIREQVPWFGDGVDRAGQYCRVIARGGMNTAWLEFEDGWQVVTSRGGIRRAVPLAEDARAASRPARADTRPGARE